MFSIQTTRHTSDVAFNFFPVESGHALLGLTKCLRVRERDQETHGWSLRVRGKRERRVRKETVRILVASAVRK